MREYCAWPWYIRYQGPQMVQNTIFWFIYCTTEIGREVCKCSVSTINAFDIYTDVELDIYRDHTMVAESVNIIRSGTWVRYANLIMIHEWAPFVHSCMISLVRNRCIIKYNTRGYSTITHKYPCVPADTFNIFFKPWALNMICCAYGFVHFHEVLLQFWELRSNLHHLWLRPRIPPAMTGDGNAWQAVWQVRSAVQKARVV